jgi:hypothetical protein
LRHPLTNEPRCARVDAGGRHCPPMKKARLARLGIIKNLSFNGQTVILWATFRTKINKPHAIEDQTLAAERWWPSLVVLVVQSSYVIFNKLHTDTRTFDSSLIGKLNVFKKLWVCKGIQCQQRCMDSHTTCLSTFSQYNNNKDAFKSRISSQC